MRNFGLLLGAALWPLLSLAACGGGGERIASANIPPQSPAPSPSPSPTPTPTPAVQGPPPPPEGPIGLVSDEPFAVLGVSQDYAKGEDEQFSVSEPQKADISFEYRSSDGAYVITLPGYAPGILHTRYYNGSYHDGSNWLSLYSTTNDLLDGESGRQDARVSLRWPGPLNPGIILSYTSYGEWSDDPEVDGTASSGNFGLYAYGIPTQAGAVPTTGSAVYNARVLGRTDQPYDDSEYTDLIQGTAQLRFNFGAGTLEGEMKPEICPWDCYPLGTYTFVQTVYSRGSSSFSGAFAVDGVPVPSWFEGIFTGPGAAELMARWQAPYTASGNAQIWTFPSGTMGGIWVGKKKD